MSGGMEEAGAEGAELAAMGHAAAALDAEIGADEFGPVPAGAVPAEPVGPDPVEETKAALMIVVGMASIALPYLPSIYTEEAVGRVAAAYVPVAQKYGWQAGGWLEKYGAEIALAATVAPLAMQTRAAHQAFVAEREAAARAAREPARIEAGPVEPGPVGPGPKTVQIGTAVPVGVEA